MNDGSIEENINIAGISSFILSDGSADVKDIERSIVEQEEIKAISETKDDNIVAEFQRRIAAMESSVGIPLSNNITEPLVNDDSESGDESGSEIDDDDDKSKLKPSSSISSSVLRSPFVPQTFADPHLNRMSHEQIKQRELQNALSSIQVMPSASMESFNLDAEKQKDKKNMLIGQIDLLRTSLEDEGRKTDDIPSVTADNTFDEVENVYKQLRYRNDHVRYHSVANEFAQVIAYGLEWAFDGEKRYFGFQPDMTGWDATLNIKMRHLSYETSSMVSETMDNYNLGNLSRLFLELVPSAILHSKMRKNKKKNNRNNQMRGPSDVEIGRSIGKLRDMDDL